MKVIQPLAFKSRLWIQCLAVVLLVLLEGCQTASTQQAAEENPITSIKAIQAEPDQYAGSEVTIVGTYRGWNLLGEAEGVSPVTRSDWVVKDDSGAIYVEANDQNISSLSPSEDTEAMVKVSGFVRLTAGNQPYIEPTSVEVVP